MAALSDPTVDRPLADQEIRLIRLKPSHEAIGKPVPQLRQSKANIGHRASCKNRKSAAAIPSFGATGSRRIAQEGQEQSRVL
jgi:hypothetical protein